MDVLLVTDGVMLRVQSGSTRGVGLGVDQSGELGVFVNMTPGEARVLGEALLGASDEEES